MKKTKKRTNKKQRRQPLRSGGMVGGPYNDTHLLNWLEENPQRVHHAKGYHGGSDAWGYTALGTWREANSLRSAIVAAIDFDAGLTKAPNNAIGPPATHEHR